MTEQRTNKQLHNLAKPCDANYALKNYFSDMAEKLANHQLTQMIDFLFWTRTVIENK